MTDALNTVTDFTTLVLPALLWVFFGLLANLLITYVIPSKADKKPLVFWQTLFTFTLPLMAIPGLIKFTDFAFKTVPTVASVPTTTAGESGKTVPALRFDVKEGMNFNSYYESAKDYLLGKNGGVYTKTYSDSDVQMMRVSAVALWILLISLMLLWLGKVFNLWCFF